MISAQTVESFTWGDDCLGWRLADRDDLQVIEERMPPGTSEQRHVHARATQTYYVLDGEATVDLDDGPELLRAGEALLIEPRQAHRISNRGDRPLQFLVISSSRTRDDRENLE